MTVTTLLTVARMAGLTLIPAGEKLHIHGPKAAEALIKEVAARKEEVLAALTKQPEPWDTATARAIVDAVLQESGLLSFPWDTPAGRESFLRLVHLEEAIDDAYLAENMTALRQAVEQWRKHAMSVDKQTEGG